MSTVIPVQCPHCGKELKLKDKSVLGKKVACPQCAEPFVMRDRRAKSKRRSVTPASPKSKPKPKHKPKPQPVEEFDDFTDDEFGGYNESYDEVSDYEDYDDFEDDGSFAEPALPPSGGRSAKPSASKKKKKRKRSGRPAQWVKPLLLVCGGVVGIAVLLGGAWMAVGMLPSVLGSGLDFAYLPDDTEAVVAIKVSDLWQSSALREATSTDEAQQAIAKMQESVGLEPSQIDSITVAATGLSSMRAAGRSMFGLPDFSSLNFVAVVKSTQPIDSAKLLSLATSAETASHSGQEYHRIGDGDTPIGKALSVFFADGQTAVLGSDELVKRAIDSGGKAATLSAFDFVEGGGDVVVAIAPRDAEIFSSLTSSLPMMGSSTPTSVADAVRDTVRGMSFSFDVGTNSLGIVGCVNCVNSSSAQGVLKGLQDSHDKQVQQIETVLSNLQNSDTETDGEILETIRRQRDAIASADMRRSGTVAILRIDQPLPQRSENSWMRMITMLNGPRGGLSSTSRANGGRPTPTTSPIPTSSGGGGYLITFELQGYGGSGDPAAAAREALSGQRNLDLNTLIVDMAGGSIQVRSVGRSINTGPAKAALQQAGFQIGSSGVRPN